MMGISAGQSDSARTKPGLPDGQMNGQVSSAGCLTDDDDSMFGRSLAQMVNLRIKDAMASKLESHSKSISNLQSRTDNI
ncbi:hypothetical protein MHYP_G00317500 [Metynnis hypsauchen]